MVDKSGPRVREMFGQIAGRYDLLNHLLSLNVDRYWRWRTVRRVPPEGEEPVLDVCTGTGDLALAYWRAGRGRAPIVGADFCRPMLAVAEAKIRKAGAQGRITLVEADAQELPFPNDTFQIVSVAFGLRNLSDTDRGLAEMARVCRPGGRVAVLEFSLPGPWLCKKLYLAYFRHVLPRVGEMLASNRQAAYNYLPASVGEFPQGKELAERMHRVGLGRVDYYPMTFGVATLYVGTKGAVEEVRLNKPAIRPGGVEPSAC